MRMFRRRSSVTGKFVSAAEANLHPDTTVAEQVDQLRPAAIALVAALRINGDVEHLSDLSLQAFDELAARL
jgi:hypothetical protein